LEPHTESHVIGDIDNLRNVTGLKRQFKGCYSADEDLYMRVGSGLKAGLFRLETINAGGQILYLEHAFVVGNHNPVNSLLTSDSNFYVPDNGPVDVYDCCTERTFRLNVLSVERRVGNA
jgi:hypothetical protein